MLGEMIDALHGILKKSINECDVDCFCYNYWIKHYLHKFCSLLQPDIDLSFVTFNFYFHMATAETQTVYSNFEVSRKVSANLIYTFK